MGRDITVGDRIASEMFMHGWPGVYRYLEEYYKTIFSISLPYSISSKMTFEEGVAYIMNNLPPSCVSYECIRSYVDFESHDLICIFQKKERDAEMGEKSNE